MKGCNAAHGVLGALLWDLTVRTGAFEAAVGVLAVVKGHAVHAQHVGLQVAFLGGTVRAVTALERSLAWRRKWKEKTMLICTQ